MIGGLPPRTITFEPILDRRPAAASEATAKPEGCPCSKSRCSRSKSVALSDFSSSKARGRHHSTIQNLHSLRGEWHLGRGMLAQAVDSFAQAVQMARTTGHQDTLSEALLALARLYAEERSDARGEAERLSKTED
jgi:hypothetical protein